MANETYLADQWLYQTLASDATLIGIVGTRFYADEVPPETIFPFVQWTLLSAVDVRGQASNRIMVNALYIVKGVGQTTSYGSLMPTANRLDDLLQGIGGDTLAGDHVYSCTREEPFRQAEYVSGKSYRHLGGVYRILVQKG